MTLFGSRDTQKSLDDRVSALEEAVGLSQSPEDISSLWVKIRDSSSPRFESYVPLTEFEIAENDHTGLPFRTELTENSVGYDGFAGRMWWNKLEVVAASEVPE